MQHLPPGAADRADRHHQRVDHDVAVMDAMVGGARDDFFRDIETLVGVLGDAGLVVGDGDHGRAVLLRQRQHRLEAFFLAGDRVQQRLALVDRQPGLQRRDNRRVDGQRHIGDRLHQFNGVGENARLVGKRNAGVDIQHLGAGRDLRSRVGLDAAVVADFHFRGQDFAPGRVDALADNRERPVETDFEFAGGGTHDGVSHGNRAEFF